MKLTSETIRSRGILIQLYSKKSADQGQRCCSSKEQLLLTPSSGKGRVTRVGIDPLIVADTVPGRSRSDGSHMTHTVSYGGATLWIEWTEWIAARHSEYFRSKDGCHNWTKAGPANNITPMAMTLELMIEH